jgi:hypothetical protein
MVSEIYYRYKNFESKSIYDAKYGESTRQSTI